MEGINKHWYLPVVQKSPADQSQVHMFSKPLVVGYVLISNSFLVSSGLESALEFHWHHSSLAGYETSSREEPGERVLSCEGSRTDGSCSA